EAHVIGYERPEGVEAAGAVVVPGVIEGCPVVSVDAGFWSLDDPVVDLTGCASLRELGCDVPYGGEVDASGLADLERASVSGCSSADFSGCPALSELQVGGPLGYLALSGASSLERLDISFLTVLGGGDHLLSGTGLAEALAGSPSLESLSIGLGWPRDVAPALGDLALPSLPSLRELSLGPVGVESLDLTGCPALEYVYCEGNLLESLDLSALPSLVSLDCSDNLLTSLDVSGCPSLTWLDCSRNRIADLSELRDWLQLKGHDGSIEPQLAGAG
ncbi:leucine-rich repeat domain-containing protein, partial [Collinsella tanakaei]|nr:leucine-rich repeat domain-containing protein [Collinsella tanakaei]